MLLFGGYVLLGPRLTVSDAVTEVTAALERPDVFESIASGVIRGDFGLNQYRHPDAMKKEDYCFVTVKMTVRNLSILPAEWALVNMAPLQGDVVLIPGEATDIRPFQTKTISASILTENAEAATGRTLWVDYYLFGAKESAIVK